MTKEFAPYQESLELKELDFNEPCFGYYGIENELNIEISSNLDSNLTRRMFVAAPTFSQAFKWFREKGYYYPIMPKMTPSNTIVYYIYEGKPKKDWNNCFKTYEEAELACLRKLIQICKSTN